MLFVVKPPRKAMPKYSYNADAGQTDLMGAAYNGDADEVAHVLSMPCDIDAQDDHGITALMYAAMKGHTQALQRLIDHTADLEIQSSQRWTAVMYAVRDGHLEVVQALAGQSDSPSPV